LPKPPGAAIFEISPAGDVFVQAGHEAAEVAQLPAEMPDELASLYLFGSRQALTSLEPLDKRRPFVEAEPACNDFVIGPAIYPCGIDLKYQMIVIAHYRIGGNVDGKDVRQQRHASYEPGLAVIE